MQKELKVIFEPKSVVLFGASEVNGEEATPAMFFRSIASNISKFARGRVYGVDLSGRIDGYEKKLTKIPKGRDLGIVSLPRNLFKKNLSSLLGKRTKALILISGEVDQKQREVLGNLAKRGKLLLLGPRATMGVINTAYGLVATPEPDVVLKRGHIAVVSQDGGLATVMLNWVSSHRVGISKFACVGEGMGIDVVDVLQYLARDKETRVICVYLEKIKDGRKLVESICEITKTKPVVVLYGGTEHEEIFRGALKQGKAFQVQNAREIFVIAEGLAKLSPMHGNRVAVITNVSGEGRLLIKFLSREGLAPAVLSPETVKKISNKYPSVNISGFVDLGIETKSDVYKYVLEQILSDKNVDGVIVINLLKSTILEPKDVKVLADAAKKSKDKPVLVLSPAHDDYLRVCEVLADTKLSVCGHPEEAALAMKFLNTRAKILEKNK